MILLLFFKLDVCMTIFELSNDFILDYFYMGEETFYLKSGLYQKLLDKAETEEAKNKIRNMYSHLKAN